MVAFGFCGGEVVVQDYQSIYRSDADVGCRGHVGSVEDAIRPTVHHTLLGAGRQGHDPEPHVLDVVARELLDGGHLSSFRRLCTKGSGSPPGIKIRRISSPAWGVERSVSFRGSRRAGELRTRLGVKPDEGAGSAH